ncbi:MAG: MBL fold metallo-hydrolase [Clostridia bacterium]|nr:MBL fold metallo-hydrolase [Clostridia bacterium]
MIIKTLSLGELMTNCYIAKDENSNIAVVIDPGSESHMVISALEDMQAVPKYIILTHTHFDHMGGVTGILEKYPDCRFVCHSADKDGLTSPHLNLSEAFYGYPIILKEDLTVKDGDIISFGNSSLKVIHTPGHTLGGICLYDKGVLFSGDTLFYYSVGRTDFPGGNASMLISSIREKLFILPEDTVVYPGHGEITSISQEKRGNPYAG